MNITLSWDASTASAPASFQTAVQYAATQLDALIKDPINVTICVGWNETGGSALGNDASSGYPLHDNLTYAQVVAALTSAATSVDDASGPFRHMRAESAAKESA